MVTKTLDTTTHEARITALEESLPLVDNARVSLEERVERLEAMMAGAQPVGSKGLDSMGLPKVV